MLPVGHRPATSWVHYTTNCNTQSSATEDWQINCPKDAELTGIINKPLLLHLVGCLYYLYFIIFFETCWTVSIYSSTECRVFHNVTFFLVRKIFTFYINDVLLFKCPFPGPKVNIVLVSPPLYFKLLLLWKISVSKSHGNSSSRHMIVSGSS